MELFIKIAQFIFIISLLVGLHELGHFLPARWFGIKVEKFFLFFDVKFALFKKKIGDTVYGIGWLPLGGYVKIAGMIDESMDTDQMSQPAQPWEFRSKPAWKRLIVMCGGVIVNFLLAWFIYSALLFVDGDTYTPADRLKDGVAVREVGEALGFKVGDKLVSVDGKYIKKFDDYRIQLLLGDEATVLRDGTEVTFELDDLGKKEVLSGSIGTYIRPRVAPIVDIVQDSSFAKVAGVQKGDKILSVNGKSVDFWDEFDVVSRAARGGDSFTVTFDRNGKVYTESITLKEDEIFGIGPDYDALEITDEYGFFASIPQGFKETIKVLTDQVRQFKIIFNRDTEGYKQVKGPIGIVEQLPPFWDWNFVWKFTAMFSVWLAFVNILPIPALDGGHVMFLLYEMISGKAPSQKTLERGQIIGFVIVMGLMLVIFGNDIWNIIKRFLD